MIVASDDASFGLPEVTRGLIAAAGGLYRLPRALPRAVALELIATGERLTADRALALGLVNRVVPKSGHCRRRSELAGTIARNAPLAVRESLVIARRLTTSAMRRSDGCPRKARDESWGRRLPGRPARVFREARRRGGSGGKTHAPVLGKINTMTQAVIGSTARTPIGRAYRGALNDIRSPTLMAHAIRTRSSERASRAARSTTSLSARCSRPGPPA